jgi:hypothetical protein
MPIDDILMLVHVPKTAGSSIHATMRSGLGDDAIRVFAAKAPALEYFRTSFAQERDAGTVRFLSAHCRLGDFPSGRRFTLLRDPIERICSLFIYAKRHRLPFLDDLAEGADFSEFWRFMKENHPFRVADTHCQFLADGTFEGAWTAANSVLDGWAVSDRVDALSKAMIEDLGRAAPATLIRANESEVSANPDDWTRGRRPAKYASLIDSMPAAARADLIAANQEDRQLYEAALSRGGFHYQHRSR